ncbi:ARM repeat-containing protein [Multifurca ochricompacta]|uniref:ARM repeat-containing protein n=1 Tax=Multifurca ochricompacta TaxID=376703 RepID=A0AAD4MHB6_9AGAM|nr:ARM repeat-containing protein [Multifurca ochricompacta]
MGKSQKKRAMRRHNPMRVPDSHLPRGIAPASTSSNKTEAVLPIIKKGKNVVGTLIGRLTDPEEEVIVEAAGALRNLCIDGGYEICAEMYNKNILAPLRRSSPKYLSLSLYNPMGEGSKHLGFQISSTLAQYIDNSNTAPENAQKVVYEFAENVITILWCLSETSNKALNAVNNLGLVPFLMAFLSSRDRLPLATVTSVAQCLYVLTDDNPPVGDEIRANLSYVSCLLDIAKARGVQDVKRKNPATEERALTLGILACGILRNLAPFPPPSSIASVDLDKEIILPLLVPVISSVSLHEETSIVRGFVQSEKPDVNHRDPKHLPRSDHKSETELGFERIEMKLRAVQLALEILTGVCATLPDPDLDPGANDDGEIEDEVLDNENAMDETPDDSMALDDTPKKTNSHTSNTPSFLSTLLEPLLTLIQPTELSFLTPSPHAPTTSALGAIHIAAFECLSNAFLALAVSPGSAVSDVSTGQRVWGSVWVALTSVGNPAEVVPGSARAMIWDVAVGVLWGVGTVWPGKIVPEEGLARVLIALCDARKGDDDDDAAVRIKCIGALSALAQHGDPASLDVNRVIVSYLLSLLVPGSTGTETMLQAVESLIDIFADERAPAEGNFRAGNVLEALAGAIEHVRRAVRGINRKKEGGRELRRHGEEVRDNLIAFVRYRRALKV